MSYVRYVERTKESKGDIRLLSSINLSPKNYEAYTSMYQFDKKILEYFERNGGSVAGYRGDAICDTVWFDIDDKDNPENTLPQVRAFLNKLLSEYNVSSKYVIKFFSGKKGFHLGIVAGFFGGFEMSETIPNSVKRLTAKMMEGFSCYDPSVYNTTRLFRLPNSMHAETGLYKRFLTTDEIFNLSFEEIETLAKNPVEPIQLEFVNQEIRPIPELHALWNMCKETEFGKQHERTYDHSNEGFFTPPSSNRNQSLFMMANKLFKKSSLSFSEIKDIILAIDANSPNPLQSDPNEVPNGMKQIEHLLRSAAGYSHDKRPVFKDESPSYITLGDSIPNLIQHIMKDDGGLTTGFHSFDRRIGKHLKGRLLTFIGVGGSKKSILAQNLIIKNCLIGNKRGLYSTMEMPTYELTSRFLDMTFKEERNYSQKLHEDLEEGKFTEEDFIAMIKEQAADRVLITETPSMTAAKYDALLTEITANNGVVDMLVVDGLSMMEDTEGEFRAMSFHSKELKELAKKWDILVIAICHVTKDVPRDARDLTPFIRGSGKVFDNSDYFVSLSNLYDYEDNQIQHLGFAKLYAKRGDGSITDVIYEFTGHNLIINESREEPSKYLAMDREKKRSKDKKQPTSEW